MNTETETPALTAPHLREDPTSGSQTPSRTGISLSAFQSLARTRKSRTCLEHFGIANFLNIDQSIASGTALLSCLTPCSQCCRMTGRSAN